MKPSPEILQILDKLIGFDTTSHLSNLSMIDYVQSHLENLGLQPQLIYDETQRKANLFCTIGPKETGGIALSGHTDVVPVQGQNWETDPFTLTKIDDKLVGRGTSDMKSFIAVCLALAPEICRRDLRLPIHLLFSYDEEIGCLGARRLLENIEQMPVKPIACIVGEPTNMQVVTAHKGKFSMRCEVKGLEGHSGLTHLGVNAVEYAAAVVTFLRSLATEFRENGPFDEFLEPNFTTVHTGVMSGGTQLNIIPKHCEFDFEFRYLPGHDPNEIFAKVKEFTNSLTVEMQAICPNTGFDWKPLSGVPALDTDPDAEIVTLAKQLTRANSTGKVSYGTEAGLFSEAGMPSIVCGPGNIEQAHKPNEWISLQQVAQCEQFIERLIDYLSH